MVGPFAPMSLSHLPWSQLEAFTAQNQSHVNTHDHMYIHSHSHGIVKKLEVVAAYNEAICRAQCEERSLSIKDVAKTYHVNWYFVDKI